MLRTVRLSSEEVGRCDGEGEVVTVGILARLFVFHLVGLGGDDDIDDIACSAEWLVAVRPELKRLTILSDDLSESLGIGDIAKIFFSFGNENTCCRRGVGLV